MFFLRRLATSVPSFLFLLSVVFLLLRFAPGGPFDAEKSWPPEVQANILAKYGLNESLPVQLGRWLSDLMHGDLRESFHYFGTPVTTLIGQSIGPSLAIGFLALGLSVLAGVGLGVLSAWKPKTALDASAVFLAIAGLSLPSYLLGAGLILVFSTGLGWFPPALLESPSAYVLPVLTLASRPCAMIARLARTSLLEAMTSDYVRFARSRGLGNAAILFKHALKNSMIPVVTLLGPLSANLITGSFVIETIFEIPGLGRHFVSAVLNRDYPFVMGLTLVYGSLLISMNIFVDLAYGWLDPRIRMEKPRS